MSANQRVDRIRFVSKLPENLSAFSTETSDEAKAKQKSSFLFSPLAILAALTLLSSVVIVVLVAILILTSFDSSQAEMTSTGKVRELSAWKSGNGNETIRRFAIEKENFSAVVTTLGAAILDIEVNGTKVALGFEAVDKYLDRRTNPYFGATVGRFANRIARGKFAIEGKRFELAQNNGPNHLHGGNRGFDLKNWKVAQVDSDAVTFSLLSEDGDENYPGNVIAVAKYSIVEDATLKIVYTATCDEATPLNLANHVYLNLGGRDAGNKMLLEHKVKINAETYLPVDETAIPIGVAAKVEKTPFDLRTPKRLGDIIDRVPAANPKDEDFYGFDHNFIVNGFDPAKKALIPVAEVKYEGRTLNVLSNQPGVQFYTGNFLDKDINGFERRGAFCLETQIFPDAVNQPHLGSGSGVLEPGQVYSHDVIYRFSGFK